MFLFYAHTSTPRLEYIVDFIGSDLFDEPITITTNPKEFAGFEGPRLNYSKSDFNEREFYIEATSLLFETGIRAQEIQCFELNYHKAFYRTKGDFPFDVFAAIFYLITRYEEYLPHEKDEYGRYGHVNSLAYKEHFLNQPLVNVWLNELKIALQRKFPAIIFKRNQFKYIPTYDIDIAYSYLNKGFRRNAGGFLRDAGAGKWSLVKERWQVLRRKKTDPFDAYEWLDALHLYCKVKPVYFFLVAQQQKGYDKNVTTSSLKFQELIEYFAYVYKIGLHPSWQSSISADSKILREEKEWLEVIVDKPIIHSRQHYIKFDLPEGYRRLTDTGITRDFSMGYGSINGFRASVASSFHWYDLQKEEKTDLRIFPFCFMDANAFFEQKLTPHHAYDEIMYYYQVVKKYNGLFVSIWHNHFLGTDNQFNGWREIYELFMKENIYWDAYSY
ncbi:MAG: polysaccharide deacetylase family protein [Gemmatimonadaceae bacterium]|nr:polysaccharide deacetylase family protein [Chitinophagaceae bacterium]